MITYLLGQVSFIGGDFFFSQDPTEIGGMSLVSGGPKTQFKTGLVSLATALPQLAPTPTTTVQACTSLYLQHADVLNTACNSAFAT